MYAEYAPPPRIADAIRCLWRSAPEPAEQGRAIVPDGCLDLIVGPERVFIAGPDTRAWEPTSAESGPVTGIRFRPGHAPRVLGVAADELRDQRVDLADLWGSEGASAADRLLSDPHLLTEVVTRRLAETEPDPELDRLLIRLDRGVPRVAAATQDLGWSERQLRRRFTVAVGYGPATYLRVARLQRAIRIAATASDLAGLAVAAGYSDQAHLSRDCRELTGRTAREYFVRFRTARN